MTVIISNIEGEKPIFEQLWFWIVIIVIIVAIILAIAFVLKRKKG